MEVEDKVALVTGGARRVGRIITISLHRKGYRVFIHCNSSQTAGNELKEELNKLREDSAEVIARDLSVNVAETAKEVVDIAATKWGRLDLLVNNASNFISATMRDITSETFDPPIDVNLKAPVFMMQAASKYLKVQRGSIVNISDLMALHPKKSHFSHSLSKAGLIYSSQCAALEFAPEIRVNAIAPGVVQWPDVDLHIFDTEEKQKLLSKTPLKKFGKAEDVAELVLFLSSPAANFITGEVIRLDGGLGLSSY